MGRMIKVRLKESVGRSLTLATPSELIIIEPGGVLDSDGFEIDEKTFEKYLKSYVERVPRKVLQDKRKKKGVDDNILMED